MNSAQTHQQLIAYFNSEEIQQCLEQIHQPLNIVQNLQSHHIGVVSGPQPNYDELAAASLSLIGTLPPLYPEWLGERSFSEVHGTRFAYVSGAMANGIASAELVIAMANANMLGFFGAAGLPYERVQKEIQTIKHALDGKPVVWGANLIHSPQEPELEEQVTELYVRLGVKRVSASAYMKLTHNIVHYACSGLTQDSHGNVHRKHHVFAKISRPEVARQFMSPAPAKILNDLVAQGKLTTQEAQLAAKIPVAEDIIVESDSGGHTDNRPMMPLFSTIAMVRDKVMEQFQFRHPIRLGAAGGIGTPNSVAAAFAMGAAFVLVGSINQGAIESGNSTISKQLLANANLADVIMAPAADMFEMGVNLQVLKKGTMFGPRAKKLYEVYRNYPSLESLPTSVKAELENKVLGESLETIWTNTRNFFEERNPPEVVRAEADPKHKMALCFRWYLGLSSRWAITGDNQRKMDYQIWCGPAMGAFNTWVKDSFLEPCENRQAVQIALNMMEGAAVITRAQQCRTYGVPVPANAFNYVPRELTI